MPRTRTTITPLAPLKGCMQKVTVACGGAPDDRRPAQPVACRSEVLDLIIKAEEDVGLPVDPRCSGPAGREDTPVRAPTPRAHAAASPPHFPRKLSLGAGAGAAPRSPGSVLAEIKEEEGKGEEREAAQRKRSWSTYASAAGPVLPPRLARKVGTWLAAGAVVAGGGGAQAPAVDASREWPRKRARVVETPMRASVRVLRARTPAPMPLPPAWRTLGTPRAKGAVRVGRVRRASAPPHEQMPPRLAVGGRGDSAVGCGPEPVVVLEGERVMDVLMT